MARRCFIDTAARIALIDHDDSLHAQATAMMATFRRDGLRLTTSEFVLLELADGFCHPSMRMRAHGFIETLRRDDRLEIIPASSDSFAAGWALYESRPDKDWSLTDCISFALMARVGIAEAFTSDHHFEQ